MNRISLLVLLYVTSLFSVDIPTEHAELRSFGKSIELNSQIIQLSNAKQSVTSLVSGHLEKYFVEAGQSVKSGQKIALIESILVSKMTADFISLKKQIISLNENYDASKKLYDKGMLSTQALNNLGIEKNSMDSKIAALRSQLQTLGIQTKNLKKATGNFILYAHSSGKVSSLLQPLHTVIREDEALITIIKDQAFYVQSYLPLKYASVIKNGQKLSVDYNGRKIVTHVTQILPELDVKTQRIVILSSVDEKADDLFVNTFVSSTLYFKPTEKHVAVKKSALSFFNNEWVVFMPTEKEKHDDHEEHGEEKHDDHEEHEEEKHDDDEDEPSLPYEARVVEIITQDDEYAGVQGIELDEEYVSDKSYYVKSMMLKSSLGEHGH
ncbi:efflux RND transporter periplasmic adaptor subunit [Candidatus Sulfurimonas marisnigri]|uniref:Efflux RND transporter periplasmic adaptor subunit n=1 Tax=Candidatus Sulfurimonas marisnigri TaxID=2740405 RepID=A0A7S7M165_9BACT|nr:efflux RND transporter periplasmic adaptor subunit [Candidatus Sulfurimonas marisnigri]QOY55162.1 efflux RND transporter periplasmic adaptor subunit [Candidatus Sulfurimonas marisnigri]